MNSEVHGLGILHLKCQNPLLSCCPSAVMTFVMPRVQQSLLRWISIHNIWGVGCRSSLSARCYKGRVGLTSGVLSWTSTVMQSTESMTYWKHFELVGLVSGPIVMVPWVLSDHLLTYLLTYLHELGTASQWARPKSLLQQHSSKSVRDSESEAFVTLTQKGLNTLRQSSLEHGDEILYDYFAEYYDKHCWSYNKN